MLKRLSALPILIFIVLIAPLQAFAQQPQQPAAPPQEYYGPGHHMWGDGYGWPFWWMFPLHTTYAPSKQRTPAVATRLSVNALFHENFRQVLH
jgi:hypothetical protein